MAEERITVMGIGNPLVKDEGVGVRVAEVLLSSFTYPDNVTVVDAGTMGMGILNMFRECDFLLVVDAVDGTGLPPGTIVRLSPEDIAPNQVIHSLHDIRFADVLQAADLIGVRPEAEFIGIQIGEIAEMVLGLTPQVEAAVPVAVDAVLGVLAAHGVTPTCSAEAGADIETMRALRVEHTPPGPQG